MINRTGRVAVVWGPFFHLSLKISTSATDIAAGSNSDFIHAELRQVACDISI